MISNALPYHVGVNLTERGRERERESWEVGEESCLTLLKGIIHFWKWQKLNLSIICKLFSPKVCCNLSINPLPNPKCMLGDFVIVKLKFKYLMTKLSFLIPSIKILTSCLLDPTTDSHLDLDPFISWPWFCVRGRTHWLVWCGVLSLPTHGCPKISVVWFGYLHTYIQHILHI